MNGEPAESKTVSLEDTVVELRAENSRLTLRLRSSEEEAKRESSLLKGERGKAERAEAELGTIKDKAWGISQTLEKYKKTVDSLSLDAEQHRLHAEQHRIEMSRVEEELKQMKAALEESKKTASDAVQASKGTSSSAAGPSDTGVWSSSSRSKPAAPALAGEEIAENGAPEGLDAATKEEFEAQTKRLKYPPTLVILDPASRFLGRAVVPAGDT
jgi:chromosome segregation ATPase